MNAPRWMSFRISPNQLDTMLLAKWSKLGNVTQATKLAEAKFRNLLNWSRKNKLKK